MSELETAARAVPRLPAGWRRWPCWGWLVGSRREDSSRVLRSRAEPHLREFETFDAWAWRSLDADLALRDERALEETVFAPIRREPHIVAAWVERAGADPRRVGLRTEAPLTFDWVELRGVPHAGSSRGRRRGAAGTACFPPGAAGACAGLVAGGRLGAWRWRRARDRRVRSARRMTPATLPGACTPRGGRCGAVSRMPPARPARTTHTKVNTMSLPTRHGFLLSVSASASVRVRRERRPRGRRHPGCPGCPGRARRAAERAAHRAPAPCAVVRALRRDHARRGQGAVQRAEPLRDR